MWLWFADVSQDVLLTVLAAVQEQEDGISFQLIGSSRPRGRPATTCVMIWHTYGCNCQMVEAFAVLEHVFERGCFFLLVVFVFLDSWFLAFVTSWLLHFFIFWLPEHLASSVSWLVFVVVFFRFLCFFSLVDSWLLWSLCVFGSSHLLFLGFWLFFFDFCGFLAFAASSTLALTPVALFGFSFLVSLVAALVALVVFLASLHSSNSKSSNNILIKAN